MKITRFLVFLVFASSHVCAASTGSMFQIDVRLHVFRDADFSEIKVETNSISKAVDGVVFHAPAKIHFDRETLILSGDHFTWNGGERLPAQFTLSGAPRIRTMADRSAAVLFAAPTQYLERQPDGSFHLEETTGESPGTPGYRLTFVTRPASEGANQLMLTCTTEITILTGREEIPGVDLDVGKPKVTVFKNELAFTTQSGAWSGVLLRKPEGSELSALLLMRVAPADTKGALPILFVEVESADDVELRRRFQRNDGRSVLYDTLNRTGARMAQRAGLKCDVVVLDDNNPTPEAGAIFRLTLPGGAVSYRPRGGAEFLYLGVPLATFPKDFYSPNGRSDERVWKLPLSEQNFGRLEVFTEGFLFGAMQMLAEHLVEQQAAAGDSN